jgi:hypothetical protein
MASSLTINSSTYAGELALPYINAAILSGDTLAKNYVTLKEGVKYKAVLKKLSNAASLVQDGTVCDFGQAGDLNLDQAVLEVKDLKTNLELCKSEFARDWEAAQTGRGFINDVVPSNFADFLIGYAAAKVGETIEYTIWQGDTAGTYDAFDGFEKKLKAGLSGSADQTWAATLSASTVIANLNAVINALPAALIGSPETKLYMNRATAQFYRQAITALGYMQMYQAADSFNLQFNGYDIYVCPGMSTGTIVAAQPSNLFVGVDANSDFAEVKVVDMSLTDASDNVRMAMRYRVGVQVGVLTDCVIGHN